MFLALPTKVEEISVLTLSKERILRIDVLLKKVTYDTGFFSIFCTFFKRFFSLLIFCTFLHF